MGRASKRKKNAAERSELKNTEDLSPEGEPRHRPLAERLPVHLLLVLAVGFLAYSNTFNSPFQWDGIKHVLGNPVIKDLDNFISDAKGYAYNPRRFVGYLTFALNYHFGGLSVTGYHVVNLLVHLANGLLVYALVLLTFRTPYFSGGQAEESKEQVVKGRYGNTLESARSLHSFVALFSALLFVAHPIQTQAVTYIVQRFTSLAAMFYLLAVVTYIKGRLGQVKAEEEEESKSPFSPYTFVWFFLSLLFAVCAMRTKEITLTLPIVIVLYEFLFFRAPIRKRLLLLAPLLLTLAIIPLSLIHSGGSLGDVLSELSERTKVQTNMSRFDYFTTEVRVVTTYIRLLFLPVNQNFDYDYPIPRSFFSLPVVLSFLFLSSIFGAAIYMIYKSGQKARGKGLNKKSREQRAESKEPGAESQEQMVKNPTRGKVQGESDLGLYALRSSPYAPYYRLIGFGMLWFFITLSVESSFIPIVDVIFEHRVYLPSAGFFIAITSAIYASASNLEKERAALYAFLVLTLVLSGLTFARNNVWKSNISLWEDVVEKSPNKARAHNNLAIFYSERGMTDQAIREFRIAIDLQPDYAGAHSSLGAVYAEQGRNEEAFKEFQTAVFYEPDFADAHYNIGTYYYRKGLMDDAFKEFQTALKYKPGFAKAHNYLGAIYQAEGRMDDALAEYRTALRLDPDHAAAKKNLDNLTRMMGTR